MSRSLVYTFVIGLIIGIILGFLLTDRGNQIIDNVVNPDHVIERVDTVFTSSPFDFEPVVITQIKAIQSTDTLYLDTVDREFINDLVAQYDCLINKLNESGFERIKEFNKVTPEGDSIYIELASVKDLILKAELKLATRDVPTLSYNTYLKPKQETEAWYIKPAIAVSTFGLGYLTGTIK